MCVFVYIYIHTYTYTYTHRYILHIYIYMCNIYISPNPYFYILNVLDRGRMLLPRKPKQLLSSKFSSLKKNPWQFILQNITVYFSFYKNQ